MHKQFLNVAGHATKEDDKTREPLCTNDSVTF